jgi:hypothetical protein
MGIGSLEHDVAVLMASCETTRATSAYYSKESTTAVSP